MADERVKAYDRHGEKITVAKDEIGQLYALGGKLATKAEISDHDLQQEYDAQSTTQKLTGAAKLAGPVGWAVNLAGGGVLPPALEAYAGGVEQGATAGMGAAMHKAAIGAIHGQPEAQAYANRTDQLQEAHPVAHGLGEAVGIIAPAVSGAAGAMAPAGAISALGGAAEVGVGALAKAAGYAGESALSRAGVAAAEIGARGAVEGGAFAASQYAGDALLHDVPMTTDKLFAATGTGALYGGAGGALLGAGGSLAASGYRAAAGGLARALARPAETAATGLAEEAAPFAGKPVSLDQATLDAGLRGGRERAESPFTIGAERRPVHIRPQGGAARGPTESPIDITGTMRIDPDAGLYAPKGKVTEPLFSNFSQGSNKETRRAAVEAGLFEGAEKSHDVRLAGDLFRKGEIKAGPRPVRQQFAIGMDPNAGLRHAMGTAPDAFRLSSAKNVPHNVDFGSGGFSELAPLEAKSPIAIPQPDAPVPTARSLLADMTTAAGTKDRAYDRAWAALGGGFGLQSTEFTKRATKYLPNGTRDVGEYILRKGIIDPNAAMLDAAKQGTPGVMVPKLQSAVESDGVRIGEITGASGGRVSVDSVAGAIDQVARKFEESAATRPIGRSVRNFGNELLDSLGANNGTESFAVQDVVRERKAIDRMVFDNVALDASAQIEAKRELRAHLEDLVVRSLDESSGRLSGEVAKEYKALKKDYLTGMIALDTAEDSAARATKAGFLGLKDLTAGGGNILKAVGHKLVRQHGDAVAATMLYQAAEKGTLAKWVQRMDDAIGKASKGLIRPPAKGLLKAGDQMPPPKQLAKTALLRVAEFKADPEAYIDKATRQTESIGAHSPELARALVARSVQAMAFLSSKVPQVPDPDPLDPHPAPKMTANEQSEFARYAWYVDKPKRFFDEVARGKVTYEGAETAQQLAPGAFQQLQERTMEALAAEMAKGNRLPFRQRQIIGVLMDVAATPSQRPDHAQFLQANVLKSDEPTAPAPQRSSKPIRGIATQRSALDRLEADGPGRR